MWKEPFHEQPIPVTAVSSQTPALFDKRISARVAPAWTAALFSLLDLFSYGVILIDSSKDIVAANAKAAVLLERGDPLLAGSGGLQAVRREDSLRLQKCIDRVLGIGAGKPLSAAALSVGKQETGTRIQLMIVALKGLHAEAGVPAAAIFIGDPQSPRRPRWSILQDWFHLTGAEARVALLLYEGKSLPEIARDLSVSVNTVKSQTQSIYTKAGVMRQGDFIRVLCQLPLVRASEE
jgi:DNA-binding CsgD family transcriptional regulator